MVGAVVEFQVGEAAELLGVSTDTMRRWVDAGRLQVRRDEHGHRSIAGPELAAFAQSLAANPDEGSERSRNVSLMSREAVDDLDRQVGSLAVAVVKSTTVMVERDPHSLLQTRGGATRET